MPTSAPEISSIDLRVACLGERPGSSSMTRSTFSTTTIASSTSRPMATTMPNSVRLLIENPASDRIPQVPSSTTGTAIVGISVARRLCRNRYMIPNTSTTATSRVTATSWIESRTNGVVS